MRIFRLWISLVFDLEFPTFMGTLADVRLQKEFWNSLSRKEPLFFALVSIRPLKVVNVRARLAALDEIPF